MNPEVSKVLQLVLEKQEGASNVLLNKEEYSDQAYFYFTSDSPSIYIPIFSERPTLDNRLIKFIDYLQKERSYQDIKLLFYTRKLKIFTYSYSSFKFEANEVKENL